MYKNINDLEKSYKKIKKIIKEMETLNDELHLLDDTIEALENDLISIESINITQLFLNNGTFKYDIINIINENNDSDINQLIENNFNENQKNYSTYTIDDIKKSYEGFEDLYKYDIENFIDEDYYYIDLGLYIDKIDRVENTEFIEI